MKRAVQRVAHSMAMVGGLVLVVLIILTCVSVSGRGLNTLSHSAFMANFAPDVAAALRASGVGPVTGDFEVLEAGIAFAIFAFLPICQLYGAHASVDLIADRLPMRANLALIAFWEVVMAVAFILIAWRLYFGLTGKMRTGETTFLLQFPVWWAYAASFVAALIAALVAIYCAYGRVVEATTGRAVLPLESEAER